MSTASPLGDALDLLWKRFLPQLEERVALIESATAALQVGVLPDTLRTEAVSAAHKLAGVLGTFGLGQGTELAREAEVAFSSPSASDPASLAEIARQLRLLLASRG